MIQRIGAYEVIRELARGGMGVVYAARDPALDRDVAIKVIAQEVLDQDALRRFEREGRAAARLRHPNIVGVHALGVLPGGAPYMVMDLIAGESLHRRVERGGPLDPAEAARLLAVVARALDYAHGRGVLHRDLKPANVLVDEQRAPHLTDFGLALVTDRPTRMTATGELMGTPVYMSPEQANGDYLRVGPPSDVYGLGATLYELLTGRTPFHGMRGVAVLHAVLTKPPEAPEALRPGLDPDLAAICTRCLEKDPAHRFSTAGALAQALEDWGARASGRGARGRRRRSSPPWLAVTAGVGALTVVAATVTTVVARRPSGADAVAAVESAQRARAEVALAQRARADALLAARQSTPEAVDALTRALSLPGLEEAERLELLARRAKVLFALERADAARRDVDDVLARDASQPLASAVRLALTTRQLPQTAEGVAPLLEELDALLARAPDLADAYVLRAWARNAGGDRRAAIADLDRALELEPTQVNGIRFRASLRAAGGDLRGALNDAITTTHLAPDDFDGWNVLALVAQAAGDRDRARAAVEQALRLRDDARLRALRASLDAPPRVVSRAEAWRMATLNDPAMAEALLTRALEQLGPHEVELLARRAHVRLRLGRIDEAMADALAVRQRETGHVVTALAVVRSQLLARDLAGAASMTEALLAANPEDAEVHLASALAWILRGESGAARPALERALELDPGLGEAYGVRATLELREGSVEAALADAERAIVLAPFESTSWSIFMGACLQLNDLPRAERASVRCLASTDGRHVDARCVLATVRIHQGDHAAALREVEGALAIDPAHLQAQVVRLMALSRLGRHAEVGQEAEVLLARDDLTPATREDVLGLLERARRGR